MKTIANGCWAVSTPRSRTAICASTIRSTPFRRWCSTWNIPRSRHVLPLAALRLAACGAMQRRKRRLRTCPIRPRLDILPVESAHFVSLCKWSDFMSDERIPLPRPRCRSLLGVRILGTGHYVPETVVTNEHLFHRFGFDSDWIVKRTGILERRHAFAHQATSDLCYEAAVRCIDNAGVNPKDIDLVVLATFTPDMAFPSTACLVQDRLKLSAAALEVEAACAGFMYALITGAAYIVSGASDTALVIGGDCNSRIMNPNDIKTYPLFGDGAGAVLMTRGRPDQGLLSYSMGADGSGGDLLSRPACGSRLPPTPELLARGLHYMHMDGRGVFRWAVAILCDTIQDVLQHSGFRPKDVNLYIP